MADDLPFNVDAIPSAAEKTRILHGRAVALAHKPEAPDAVEDRVEVVEFLLAQEHYAIESAFVREVQPLKGLTPLPCTPPFILGIVNVRGQILTVIDLKRFFDLPEHGITDLDKLIVVRSGPMELGILADVIAGVRLIPKRSLQPALPTLSGVRADFLKGISEDRAALLDAEKLLADKRIVVCEEV
jgi:purine-binding chemotaxis protein CheW